MTLAGLEFRLKSLLEEYSRLEERIEVLETEIRETQTQIAKWHDHLGIKPENSPYFSTLVPEMFKNGDIYKYWEYYNG